MIEFDTNGLPVWDKLPALLAFRLVGIYEALKASCPVGIVHMRRRDEYYLFEWQWDSYRWQMSITAEQLMDHHAVVHTTTVQHFQLTIDRVRKGLEERTFSHDQRFTFPPQGH